MLLESLAPVGAVAIGLAILLILIYYILFAEPAKPTDSSRQGWPHHPLLDDDLQYLISYYDCVYVSILPLNTARQDVGQPAQQTMSLLPLLPLPYERQEAIQPA